ncbi:MAG: 1-acyl-sn-glycerol-3-phosphate acyltransferase [Clostridia bacterium]|nr:1-acyl-sn-glycerol-3-phosphate acyltransferase [Clostridia bacterium]
MKKKKKIGRPAPWLYWPAVFIMRLIYGIKYRLKIDRSGIKGMKGPALVLCPHVSGKDHVLTALALAPRRPTYVLSYHFWAVKPLRPLLKLMRVITKRMYCADGAAVLNIMRAAKEGNVTVLFPEGRLTWYGRSLNLTEGTAELVKKLRIPVFTIVSEGAGKCFPKWAKYPRRGKICIRTDRIFDAEQVKALSVQEIKDILAERMRHDGENDMPGEKYRAKDLTAGLDGIIWKCPLCGAEKSLKTENGRIRCACGLDAALDEYGVLHGAGELKTVSDWYLFCENSVDTTVPLEREVTVSATDEKGYMQGNVGRGILTADREKTSFSGSLNGEKVCFSVPASASPAFPVSVADHIDLYHENRLYYFSPVPDPRDSILFVAYREKLMKEEKNSSATEEK